MSFGRIYLEENNDMDIEMNKVGGKYKNGEGGEDDERYIEKDKENKKRYDIKKVESGRFGVKR